MPSLEFYDENSHALRDPNVIVRDHLGDIALQLLLAKTDISQLSYGDLLDQYRSIVIDLQKTYQQKAY